ncbi:MAG: AAA family ATPase [Runella sp.]
MIPLKLTLQGIQSYRERQEIDFQVLTEAGIFGIFGKVGSGKSTILEAITFCLYNDTERLNKQDERGYNLMNLRSDKLYIDFEFRAGREQNRYRFVVEGKRNGRQFHLVTLERKAYQWLPQIKDWSPIATENPIERIMGLSYDNFKRTVIIPQGRFQEFIELTDKNRTQMMKELFQLERFELAEKVKPLIERNNEALARIEGQIGALGEVSVESMEQDQHQLKNIQELLTALTQNIQQKRQEIAAIEALKKIFDQLLETTASLQKLEDQKEDFKIKKQNVALKEQCLQIFKPILDELAKAKDRSQKESDALEIKNKSLQQLNQNIKDEEQQIALWQTDYDQRHLKLQQADELRVLAQILTLEQELKMLQVRTQKGEIQYQEKIKEVELRKQQLQQQGQQLQTLRQDQPDFSRLAEVKAWFDRKNQLLKEREDLKILANEWVAKQSQIEQQKAALMAETQKVAWSKSSESLTFEEIFGEIELARTQWLQRADELDPRIVQLKTQQALAQYAATLHEGDPCPLCGATHHPAPLNHSTDWDTQIQSLQQQQNQWRQIAQTTLQNLFTQFTALEKEFELIEAQKKILKEKTYPEKNQQIKDHEQTFVGNEFDPNQPDIVANAWQEAEAKQKEIDQRQKWIDEETQTLEKLQDELREKYEQPLSKFREKIAAQKGEINSKEQQLKNINKAEWEGNTPLQLQELADQWQQKVEKLTKEYETLAQQLQSQKQEQKAKEGEIKALEENLKNTRKEIETLENQLQSLLNEHQKNETEVREILAWPLDIAAERQAIQKYETDLQATQIELGRLQNATEDKTLDANLYQTLLHEIETLEADQTKYNQEVGRLKDSIEKQQQQLEKQKGLLEEKHQHELRKADLETLAKLFKGSGFVNYVSSVYLQNLCQQANQRFHLMTRQQLQLEIDEENRFQVRDFLNDGKTRHLKSLSGGQKFQAALSLALALADNVHTQIQSKENFFFLDEGFGSLDKESLQTVFDTLKSLRRENRIVGVISHVEELQQEIERYLSISNDDERGSLVKIGR